MPKKTIGAYPCQPTLILNIISLLRSILGWTLSATTLSLSKTYLSSSWQFIGISRGHDTCIPMAWLSVIMGYHNHITFSWNHEPAHRVSGPVTETILWHCHHQGMLVQSLSWTNKWVTWGSVYNNTCQQKIVSSILSPLNQICPFSHIYPLVNAIWIS